MSDTINLGDDQAQYIDALVRSGRFADRREVVQAGLNALRDRDATVERWLREDVVPVAAAMMADPSRTIPIDAVMDDLERHHHARVAETFPACSESAGAIEGPPRPSRSLL